MRARNDSDEKTARTPFQKFHGPSTNPREGRGGRLAHAGELLVHGHVHQERHREPAFDVEHGRNRQEQEAGRAQPLGAEVQWAS